MRSFVIVVLVSTAAVAGPPRKPRLSADARALVAQARQIVVASPGKVARCTDTPATTCARVTLKIERSLKGSLAGEVTVRTDGVKPGAGRGVFLLSRGSFGLTLTARASDPVEAIEAQLAALCATPDDGQPCAEFGAFCALPADRACLCSLPLSGIEQPREAARWSCEPQECFEAPFSGPCDGGVLCKWSFCSAGQWKQVPPPP